MHIKGQEPIGAFFPLLVNEEEVQEAITEKFGEDAPKIIEQIRSGATIESSVYDFVSDIIQNLVSNDSSEVDTLYGLGYAGEFPIRIMTFGEMFWIDAQEFDSIGYFRNIDAAISCAESEWAPFIEKLAEKNKEDEEDEEDNEDESEDEEIKCPYCSSAENCPHLLAVIDRSFNECTGGYIYPRFNEFRIVIEKEFGLLFKNESPKELSWDDDKLNELWGYAISNYPNEDGYIFIDSDVLTDLIISFLEDAGATELRNSTDNAPGMSSTISVLFAEKPETVFTGAINNVKEALESKTV